jgi:hypothetical protein
MSPPPQLTLDILLWQGQISKNTVSYLVQTANATSARFVNAYESLQAMQNAAANALKAQMKIPLSNILGVAWSDIRTVRETAKKQRQGKSGPASVPLLTHDIHSIHNPTLNISVNNVHVCSVEFTVDLVLHLEGVILGIQAARINRLTAGGCNAIATLSCGGVELVNRETRHIKLPMSVNLGNGFASPFSGMDNRKFAARCRRFRFKAFDQGAQCLNLPDYALSSATCTLPSSL